MTHHTAEIAAKMTDREKFALRHVSVEPMLYQVLHGEVRRRLFKAGLLECVDSREVCTRFRITPLGLDVRGFLSNAPHP